MPDASRVVVDASAVVDLLLGASGAERIAARTAHSELHAPAHIDSEILSALGRLNRAGILTDEKVVIHLEQTTQLRATRHAVGPLLVGAWQRRHNISVADALYVELAEQLDAVLVTTDARLASAHPGAELIEP